MSNHKITDFVDQSAIDGLKRLKEEMVSVKDTYIEVARELVKGMKVPIDSFEDLERENKRLAELQQKAAEASQRHAKALAEQEKIVANTTNTISRELMEQEKVNKVNREAYTETSKVKELLAQVNGTYENNIRLHIQLKDKIAANKQQQVELDTAYKMGRISMEDYQEQQIKLVMSERELKQSKAQLTTLLKNEEREAQSVEGSYNNLSQKLELLKKAYKNMTDEEKASPLGGEMETAIQSLDAHLKDLAADMGEFQRNTGNYAISGGSVKKQLKEMVLEIANLTVAYQNLSAEEQTSAEGQAMKEKIQQLTEEAGVLRDAVADTTQAINNAASDTRGFDQISGGIQLLIDGFGLATGTAQMLGLSEDDLIEVQTKLQAALVASNALTQIQANLQKQSALMQGVSVIQTKSATIAENLKTAATGKGVIATKAATIAQKAFNAVAKANPYVLLAMAIITVVGALAAFASGSKKAREEEARHQKEMEESRQQYEKMRDSVADSAGAQIAAYMKLRRAWNDLGNDLEKKKKFIDENKEAFRKLGYEINNVNDAERFLHGQTENVVKAFILRAKAAALDESVADTYKTMIKEQDDAYQATLKMRRRKKGDYVTKEEYDIAGGVGIEKEYDPSKQRHSSAVVDYKIVDLDAYKKAYTDSKMKERKALQDQAKAKADAQIARLTKDIMETQAELNKTIEKIGVPTTTEEEPSNGPSGPSAITNKAKSLEEIYHMTLNSRKKTIDAQLALEEEGSAKWLDLKSRSLDLGEEIELSSAKETYNKLMNELEESHNQGKISDEDYEATKTQITQDYADKRQAIIEEAKVESDEALETVVNKYIEGLEKAYAEEQTLADAKYADDQNRLQKEYAEQLKLAKNDEERAKAKQKYDEESAKLTEDYTKDTINRQIEMYEKLLDSDEIDTEKREKMAVRLAKLKQDLAKATTDAEIAEIERRLKAEQDANNQDTDDLEKKLGRVAKWLGVASDAMNELNDLAASIYDAKIERLEEEQEANDEASEREQERISELVEKKVITEEEGEARKRAAEAKTAKKNEELEKKKQKLKERQAIWDKANSIAQVGMSTALAIMNALQTKPFPVGLAMAAIAATMGAIQTATILATPIPKYAKGTKNHPGGLAIVGDGGRHELVSFNGDMFITPDEPTLIDMPKGAEVLPDIQLLPPVVTALPELLNNYHNYESPKVVVNNDYTELKREIKALGVLIGKQTEVQRQAEYDAQYERYKMMRGL